MNSLNSGNEFQGHSFQMFENIRSEQCLLTTWTMELPFFSTKVVADKFMVYDAAEKDQDL